MAGALLHSPADVVRGLLVDLGLGSDPPTSGFPSSASWPVFVAAEPDLSDDTITVYDTAGKLEGRFMTNGETQGHAGIQVRIRCTAADTGYAKVDAIKEALDKHSTMVRVTVDSSVYLISAITRTGDVLSLGGQPGTGRVLFTLNALVALRQIS